MYGWRYRSVIEESRKKLSNTWTNNRYNARLEIVSKDEWLEYYQKFLAKELTESMELWKKIT